MPEETLPLKTQLTLILSDVPNSPIYSSTLVGVGRIGLQLSLPQVLNTSYSLPVPCNITCHFLAPRGQGLLAFRSYVMGYERTTPPLMVIETPTAIEPFCRRAAKRYSVAVPVGYMTNVRGIPGDQSVTEDLSLGGLRMKTYRPLPVGAVLSLTLKLPTDILLATGCVVWSSFRGKDCMAGVRFDPLKTAESAILSRFLGDLERQQAGVAASPHKG